MKKYLFLILLMYSFTVFSQNEINGKVITRKEKKVLVGANILNLNSVNGTSTDNKGNFNILAKVNDTLIISYVGYESIKLKVTNDLLKIDLIEVALHEKPEKIKEVVVKSTKLIGVLEVDINQVPKERFTRVKLNGVKQTYEVNKPKKVSLLSKIFNPVDAVYNLFGKKPKNLRKLKKLKKEDKLRDMFAGKFDREVMMEYLEMNREELTKLLSNCNYSDYFIKKASDLQLIEAILNCYENYKAVKKGSIGINRLPE